MTQYAIVTDCNRCIGCLGCSVACKAINGVPTGNFWNKTLRVGPNPTEGGSGNFPDVEMYFMTISCQHCENPACTKVCPVGATYKDPETGIVRQDYDKCIGCRMCIAACPYTGVRSFNWQEPAYPMDFAVGDADAPAHQKHTVEKCTFCYQRQARGEVPACMDLCPARARFWGDLDDPDSDVSKLLREREYMQLLPEKGTKPSTYYLV